MTACYRPAGASWWRELRGTAPPPGAVPGVAPLAVQSARVVGPTLLEGLVRIDEECDAEEPWARLDPMVDVLLKGAAVPGRASPPVWELVPARGPHGSDTWHCRLPVPLDVLWLRMNAVLPPDLLVFDFVSALPSISDSVYVVTSREDAHDPRWLRAGWRSGQDWSGTLPKG